jgi:hypothetical protein
MYLPFVFTLGWPNSSTRLSYGIGLADWFACNLCESWAGHKDRSPPKGYLLEFTSHIKHQMRMTTETKLQMKIERSRLLLPSLCTLTAEPSTCRPANHQHKSFTITMPDAHYQTRPTSSRRRSQIKEPLGGAIIICWSDECAAGLWRRVGPTVRPRTIRMDVGPMEVCWWEDEYMRCHAECGGVKSDAMRACKFKNQKNSDLAWFWSTDYAPICQAH